MYRRRLIKTTKLVPGMISDQGVYDLKGHTLVVPGSYLDDHEIKALIRLGIEEIYIQSGEIQLHDVPMSDKAKRAIDELYTDDPAKITFTDEVRERVCEGISYMYNNTDSPEMDAAASKITDELMNVLDKNNAIVLDVSELRASDEYTFKHSVDVASLSMILAKRSGYTHAQVKEIGMSGLLHDVGKTRVPPEILNKPGKLTDEEFHIMKQHALYGYNICKEHGCYSHPICLGVLQHHEKMNGKGYPFGVAPEKIFPYARIMAVADVYDALVTDRPYKKAMSQREAVEIVLSMSEELEFNALSTFMKSVILYPVGCIVTLSNGEMCQVVKNDASNILRPTVVAVESGNVYNLSSDINCASLVIQ